MANCSQCNGTGFIAVMSEAGRGSYGKRPMKMTSKVCPFCSAGRLKRSRGASGNQTLAGREIMDWLVDQLAPRRPEDMAQRRAAPAGDDYGADGDSMDAASFYGFKKDTDHG